MFFPYAALCISFAFASQLLKRQLHRQVYKFPFVVCFSPSLFIFVIYFFSHQCGLHNKRQEIWNYNVCFLRLRRFVIGAIMNQQIMVIRSYFLTSKIWHVKNIKHRTNSKSCMFLISLKTDYLESQFEVLNQRLFLQIQFILTLIKVAQLSYFQVNLQIPNSLHTHTHTPLTALGAVNKVSHHDAKSS